MSDAIDLLSRGLGQASGLSLTTHGLLLESSEGTSASAGLVAALDGLLSDVAIQLVPGSFASDFGVEQGQLVVEHGLLTSVVMSLFTDRLAEADDELPGGDGDRRGWWADGWPVVDGDRIGSRLWLLNREKHTTETLLRAEEYARESLAWLIEDGVAETITVAGEWIERGFLGLEIVISRPQLPNARFRFAVAWEAV